MGCQTQGRLEPLTSPKATSLSVSMAIMLQTMSVNLTFTPTGPARQLNPHSGAADCGVVPCLSGVFLLYLVLQIKGDPPPPLPVICNHCCV